MFIYEVVHDSSSKYDDGWVVSKHLSFEGAVKALANLADKYDATSYILSSIDDCGRVAISTSYQYFYIVVVEVLP